MSPTLSSPRLLGGRALLLASLAMAPVFTSFSATTAIAETEQTYQETIVEYHTQQVGDVEVFYREAGSKDNPTLLLLHGYPSSSHQFRNLIPLLANDYHIIAPDYPGFGQTLAPSRAEYDYTFDNLAATTRGLTDALGLEEYAMYVFDYGAPIGFRLATANPERITAIITQNGNAYEEGLTEGWAPIQKYWAEPTEENRVALLGFQALETTRWQYSHGTPDDRLDRISLDPILHDMRNFGGDEGSDIQLDLFGDYKSNVALYPEWQAYLRENQPPVLAVWGQNDPFFAPAGAEAFLRDVPNADVKFIDAGHFPLETHLTEIASEIDAFLSRVLTD
jgi:pimeloyl-ACP methyl ester carboxylesterase